MKRTLTALISCGSLAWSFGVIAQVDTLQTGEHPIVSNMTDAQEFAGHQFELSNFSGVFGMSSNTAYVVTKMPIRYLVTFPQMGGDFSKITSFKI